MAKTLYYLLRFCCKYTIMALIYIVYAKTVYLRPLNTH